MTGPKEQPRGRGIADEGASALHCMREALAAMDPAVIEAQLLQGGEEGLTDAQLQRCASGWGRGRGWRRAAGQRDVRGGAPWGCSPWQWARGAATAAAPPPSSLALGAPQPRHHHLQPYTDPAPPIHRHPPHPHPRSWLAARGHDPARAARDLAAHAEWRAAFVPDGRFADADVANELAQEKVLIQGPCTRGRALLVFNGAKHFPR
jgi:hypothetical protein